ncbi:MAG TPA: helix-turn-helix domain-containing protein [Allosphingosinicella sp.]|jgi:AraC-like DNA-binding protein|nr:helix-turn-helix domain-containing protein [Allosphingosinicella sp.]
MYREYSPGPTLAQTVECYWSSAAMAPAGGSILHRVLPDGCMDLLFDFAAAGGNRTTIVGTMTRPLLVTSAGATDLFGIRFRPGGIICFLPLDATELTDDRADLSVVAGRLAGELWDRLAEAAPDRRAAVAEAALLARLPASGLIDPYVLHCVARLEATRGALPIARLEASTGLSGRQIERKFARHVGLSPKTFARVIRFRSLLSAAWAPGPRDWAGLAVDAGYADQPHLVREFRSLAGLSPTAYFAAREDDVGFVQDGPPDLA